MSEQSGNHIGTLQERSLHAALKEWAALPGDQFEVNLEGYVIDILRDDRLIEIQTGNFTKIRNKLAVLLENYPVNLIHPIANNKWIIRQDKNGEIVSKRKSPKKGRVEEVFRQAIRMPDVLNHPNLVLQVVLVDLEEYWVDDGQGSWRRKYWSKTDQKLLDVVATKSFTTPSDYANLLPAALPNPFTNKQLSKTLSIRPSLAGKMTYTLRKMGILEQVGKQGRANIFALVD